MVFLRKPAKPARYAKRDGSLNWHGATDARYFSSANAAAAFALSSCALIGLSSAAMILARYQRGGACGEAGVRSGCFSYTYGELEEWRLTGDHLRFRVGEIWRAVSLPEPLHAEVRGLLQNQAGGLESRFSK